MVSTQRDLHREKMLQVFLRRPVLHPEQDHGAFQLVPYTYIMPELRNFYNKRKLYYTESMKKKPTYKVSKQTKTSPTFEPVMVSLAVASFAAVTILLLAVVAVSR